MSVNKAILIGNLGKDPEVRILDSGRSVANFSMATSESYKDKSGEKVTNTTWHNIVLWGPLAEIAEKYVKKGDRVYIEGRIENRTYEDKDGNTRYVTEIIGREMTMLGGNKSQESAPAPANVDTSTGEVKDDLPF